MAIVTIGQIKHRRGILGIDPMPQLGSAEFGWGIDLQELYIGNGTISEGAPAEGNTEILTEHSDLIALLSDYTYAGPFSGAIMSTSAGLPITRTFIERYDDNVSVRAFGATGDGVTDDADAIERAIYQHTLEQPLDNEYWTTIYFPAGTYLVSRMIEVPSHVRLVGDGMESSIISLSIADTAVMAIRKMVDPNTLGDIFPVDIHVAGLGLVATQASSHGLLIGDANNILFERVGFNGASVDRTVVGTSNAAVLFQNVNQSSADIRFTDSLFTTATFGIATGIPDASNTRQDISSITVTNSRFYDLYKGALIGNEADNVFALPSNWSFAFNSFDVITKEGIHTYQANRITSGQNHFGDVGDDQISTPATNCIFFGDTGGENPVDTLVDLTEYEGNYSIGDTFDRDDADNALFLRVNINCLNSYAIDSKEITWGTLKVEPGRLILLADDTTVAATTGITLDIAQYQGAIIDYQLNRTANQIRTGTIEIANGTTSASMNESYTEEDAVGVTLSISDNGAGLATIEYVSTDDANDITLSYSIRHLTCIPAVPTAAP